MLELEVVRNRRDVPRRAARRVEPDGFPLACGTCGGLDVDVVQGEELQVESLELEAELSKSGG